MWLGSIASGKHHHGRWELVLPVWSGIKTAIDVVVFTNFPMTKKGYLQKSNVKTLLIAFFDNKGIIHNEFMPAGQTINAAFYKAVLNQLLQSIRWVQHRTGKWMLLHNIAPAHSAIHVLQFLAQKMIAVLDHPPYIPDLAPADFFLFPCLKATIKCALLWTWMPSKIVWQPFCDRFHRRPLQIVSGSCTNVVKCVL